MNHRHDEKPLQKTQRHSASPVLVASLSRRRFLTAITALPLAAALSACAGRNTPSEPLPSITLDDFPTGLGRGYPITSLEGVPRNNPYRGPGHPAPDFRIQLADGSGLYLSDLRGRPVLINFWATWCGPCRLEMPDIVHQSNTQRDLVVLAVNVQEELPPVEAFAADFGMTMPIPLDTNGQVRDLYAVRGMPTSVFINRDGVIQSVWAGALSPRKLSELLAEILPQAQRLLAPAHL